jgi:hypothetical protein
VRVEEGEYLKHYGILRRSGRYPWGSGDNPHQRSMSFLDMVAEAKKQGLSDPEIARGFGMTTTELRQTRTLANAERKAADIARATMLKERGMSKSAIGREMDKNESVIRSLLAEGASTKINMIEATSSMLRDQVKEKGFVDIGTGVENQLGMTRTKLDSAIARLRDEGYEVHRVKIEQLGTGKFTDTKVLGPPGSEQ